MAHINDVAKLYVLAPERGEPGARYHASVEESVDARTFAEAIGEGTRFPVQSSTNGDIERYFNWMTPFIGLNKTASSAWAQARLGWEPNGPGLLADLPAMDYAEAEAA